MRERTIIFGAGAAGRQVYHAVKSDTDVIAFVDNDEAKWGGYYEGIKIQNTDILKEPDRYDKVILGSPVGFREMQEQLSKLGVPSHRVDGTYTVLPVKARIIFLKRYSEMALKGGIAGAVAEAGVFRGEFAREINYYFKDRECYLFDTFDGFDKRDVLHEKKISRTEIPEHYGNTSEQLVLEKMQYPDKVHIKKGYFPQSIGELDIPFAFVNLDMDLYQPTLEGLRYFYPRMSDGGIILVHDYFSEVFPNIKAAIGDYEKETGRVLKKMPIGDELSIAIIK